MGSYCKVILIYIFFHFRFVFQEHKTLTLSDCQPIGLPANSGLSKSDATVRERRLLFFLFFPFCQISALKTLAWWLQTRIRTQLIRACAPALSPLLFTVHLVDVWNMIEAFRDNGLNTLDHNAEISVSRLETILSSIYYQLNKRLPTTHQINVEQSIGLLLNFMVATYDRLETCGQHRGLKLQYCSSEWAENIHFIKVTMQCQPHLFGIVWHCRD